jgi:hypothetical protein
MKTLMSRFCVIGDLLGAYLMMVGCCAAAAPQSIFYAPFDGSATASIAAGEAEPLQAEQLAFVPGLKGQAVRLDSKTKSRLAYAFDMNVEARKGSVAFWFKPEWNDKTARNRHYLFAFNYPWTASRAGTGALYLWSYGGRCRADRSDRDDHYLVARYPFRTNDWHHIAYVWDENRTVLFVDGAMRSGGALSKQNDTSIDWSQTFDSFFIGGCREGNAADGLVDEFRIFSEPLTEQEIAALRAEFAALNVECVPLYFSTGRTGRITAKISNGSGQLRDVTWMIGKQKGIISIPARTKVAFPIECKSLPAGQSTLRLSSPGVFSVKTTVWGLKPENPVSIQAGTKLEMHLVDTLVLDKLPPSDRFVTTGEQVLRELKGQPYMETGKKRGSRFAVRFHLPGKAPLYCFEWDYPDDAYRMADIIVQPVDASSQSRKQHGESDIHDYQLQVGYMTGDEYPNQNKMLTARCLYWAKTRDVAVVFSAIKDSAPAAVSAIRLYQVVGGLPDAGVLLPKPVDGWNRSIALYYEDPAIAYDFATDSRMPGFEDLINRTMAYMKYSGQDLFVYPGVWYHGLLGPDYAPRPKTPHAPRYLEAWMAKFDVEGLGVMPSFNIFDVPALRGLRTDVSVTNGSLHNTCAMVLDSGLVAYKTSHGRAPVVNILHPDAQAEILRDVDALIALGRTHPSFKGIDFRLSEHCCLWLGNIYAGYNDFAINAFTKATGIRVPVNRDDPLRGKAYAVWLMANARDEWTDWRCREIARFYKQIAARLAQARPDLRLVLSLLTPLNHRGESSYNDPHFVNTQNKQAGVDTALFADTPNIIISQGCRPMRYRAGYDAHRPNYDEAFFRDAFYRREYYESLDTAGSPWIHNHDHYFETSFGDIQRHGKSVPPLKASWFKEHPWRVSTINPAGYYAMKQYVLPLRYHDLLGITRGGFLIGTYGLEEYLIPFAKAFRALPAKPFADLSGGSGTLKVRTLIEDGETWFYAVNTADCPQEISIITGSSQIIDLITGVPPAEWSEECLKLTLAPYQLRSFHVAGELEITVR